MAKVALALTKVTCANGTTDYNVGLNPNTNADDKVQSFVDAFKSVGNTASSTCHGLPLKLILAMWGGESGWATGTGAFPAAPYQRGGTGTAEAFRLRYPASGSGNAGSKGKWKRGPFNLQRI